MKTLKIQKTIFRNIDIKSYEVMQFQSKEILKFIEINRNKFDKSKKLMQQFHNDQVQYSGIQLASEHYKLSITAYGKKNIKAVDTWWKVYRKAKQLSDKNILKISENYQLQYLEKAQIYEVKKMLINREKYEQLKAVKNNSKRFNQLLSEYLTANFLPLYNMIDHWHDKDKHDVQTRIISVKEHVQTYPVYRKRYRHGFDIVFSTNLLLPYSFRMGESAVLGYGTVNFRR